MNERSARAMLGVSLPATTGQIKRAYRRLALELHPDRGGNSVAFQQLVEAQNVLLRLPAAIQPTQPRRSRWFEAPADRSQPVPSRTTGCRTTVRTSTNHRPATPLVQERRFGDVLAEKLAAA